MTKFKLLTIGFSLLSSVSSFAGQAHGNCRNDAINGACNVRKVPCLEKISASQFMKDTDSKKLTEFGTLFELIEKADLFFSNSLNYYIENTDICVVDYDLNNTYGKDYKEEARITLWIDSAGSLNPKAKDRIYVSKKEFFENPNTSVDSRTFAIYTKLLIPETGKINDSEQLKVLFWETAYYSNQILQKYKQDKKKAIAEMRDLVDELGFVSTNIWNYAESFERSVLSFNFERAKYIYDYLDEKLKKGSWDLRESDLVQMTQVNMNIRFINDRSKRFNKSVQEIEAFLKSLNPKAQFIMKLNQDEVMRKLVKESSLLNIYKIDGIDTLIRLITKAYNMDDRYYVFYVETDLTNDQQVIGLKSLSGVKNVLTKIIDKHQDRIQFIESVLRMRGSDITQYEKFELATIIDESNIEQKDSLIKFIENWQYIRNPIFPNR